MTAELMETPDEHRWTLRDHRVTLLAVDLRSLRFQTWTLEASAEIRLGAPFIYVEPDGLERRLSLDEPEQLAPLLSLLGRSIDTLLITRRGQLAIRFGDGSSITIEPHARTEAWEIQGGGALEGLGYLCQPGGGTPWRAA
jgi:hypothetical protein